jgi:hypothetical protein
MVLELLKVLIAKADVSGHLLVFATRSVQDLLVDILLELEDIVLLLSARHQDATAGVSEELAHDLDVGGGDGAEQLLAQLSPPVARLLLRRDRLKDLLVLRHEHVLKAWQEVAMQLLGLGPLALQPLLRLLDLLVEALHQLREHARRLSDFLSPGIDAGLVLLLDLLLGRIESLALHVVLDGVHDLPLEHMRAL